MRTLLGTLPLLVLVVAPLEAADIDAGQLEMIAEVPIGLAGPLNSPRDVVPTAATLAYSNVTNFAGAGSSAGGATVQGSNTITRLMADDITPIASFGGLPVLSFRFSLVNLNATVVSFRPRVRFWFADGGGGAPGTYYNVPAPVGFTFAAVTMNPGTASTFLANLTPGQMDMPAGTFWAGITFDDDGGTTGASFAEMNNVGMAIFDPPTDGSSSDVFFRTTAAGSFFLVNNPTGAGFNFSGSPIANFGWEFTADDATPNIAVSWGRVKALYR